MKKTVLSYLFLLLPLWVMADPVRIGDLLYELSSADKTAEVAYHGGTSLFPEDKYKGDIVIPETVKYNGVTYQVTKIGDSAFYGCGGVTSIILPSSIKEIGDFAFQDCNIESINLPAGLMKIGNCAFSGTDLQSIDIPASVTEMGSAVFLNCFYDIEVNITDLKAWCNISFGGYLRGRLKLILNGEEVTNLVIPDGVKTIGDGAFGGFIDLKSVVIPAGVEKIGEDAFCYDFELTSVTIPNTVTSIGTNAFYSDDKLSSFTIPGSVKSIGESAFWSCVGISDLVLPEGLETIGNDAFGGCGVKTLKLPNSLKKVGDYAFDGCTKLTSVTIPKGLTDIGYCAFRFNQMNAISVDPANPAYDSRNNCNALIETATNTLLAGCKNTIIPNTVTAIGDGAFSYNQFTTISIPNSVTSIGLGAFESCTNLKSIMIPASVQKLDNAVFYNCHNLLALSVPEGITVIPESFCYECTAMETMILPSTTKEVWAGAFNGNLKDLYCFAMTPPQEVYGSFLPWIPDEKGWYYYATTLHVPAAALQSYKDSEVWGIFQEILPMTDEETGIMNTNCLDGADVEDSWWTLSGVKLEGKPTQKGIYLHNGKKVAVQ